MASRRPLQLLHSTSTSAIPQSRCPSLPNKRCISSTPARLYTPENEQELTAPRWKQTPKAMIAPVRLNPLTPNSHYVVNTEPKRLDKMYNQFLGPGSCDLLSEETKWLAVTHKSFDHGRRGFNDRLTFLGKRIVDLQASLAVLANGANQYPSAHPALDGLDFLTAERRKELVSPKKLYALGIKAGMRSAMRWKPRRTDNLSLSGEHTVINGTIYAIIGALALERGGEVANRMVRERILKPIGMIPEEEATV
ncbi:RNase III domain protein [Pseudovirgaria hyperparasitica]|uniref:RNase III domain protein n=1 Tax=Pseudovirgaria hyperparasitica TaxID=470096 RepID=A0A6A6VW11_9PEZI|nr:RNase III domain protein [Pseudovirgaria hyperparasitica]KAF2754772.1 RNase III domain protein [Pseudovirgaria hyperparasitica]